MRTRSELAGEMWHSDVSCSAEPTMGSILRLFEVPERGGDTLFGNMYAAYDILSERMKAYIADLAALHDGGPYYREVNSIVGRDDGGRVYPAAEQPIVRTHPVTARKCLYVNPMFTTRIIGVPKLESDSVLRLSSFRHIADPQFQCRFRWERNSVAFWDNRCAQHFAVWDYSPQCSLWLPR